MIHNCKTLTSGLATLACLVIGCSTWQASPIPRSPGVNPKPITAPSMIANSEPDPVQSITISQQQFGFALLAALQRENPDQNLLISPISVAMALTMAYNGAATDTQTAMAAVLGLQGLRLEQVNQANQALLGHLTNLDSSLELAMANSLWLNQSLPVRREFVDQVRGTYGAEVASLNFADPDAVRQINQWVSRQTRDRIPTILDTIPPDQLLFLLNAVYFKGAWTRPFNPDLTRDRPFTLTDGTVLNLPTMEQRGDYLYLETNALQVVSLPYGNQSLSLDIILPAPAVNLEQMIPQLTVDTWETWSQQLRSRPGRIQLPRFEMTYEANLIPALESLGMGMAFSDQADFSGLTSLQAMINQVRHRTYLEVTEKGTEAAAVTSVGIAVTSAPMAPEQPFEMVMDRPFAMVLRDRQSGTLLFLGIVRDPR